MSGVRVEESATQVYMDDVVGPQITIYVGRHNTEFRVSRSLLCRTPFFDYILNSNPIRYGEDPSLTLSDFDEYAFHSLIFYLHKGDFIFHESLRDYDISDESEDSETIQAIQAAMNTDLKKSQRMFDEVVNFAALTERVGINEPAGDKDLREETNEMIDQAIQMIAAVYDVGQVILPHHIRAIAKFPKNHIARKTMVQWFGDFIYQRSRGRRETPHQKLIVDSFLRNDEFSEELAGLYRGMITSLSGFATA